MLSLASEVFFATASSSSGWPSPCSDFKRPWASYCSALFTRGASVSPRSSILCGARPLDGSVCRARPGVVSHRLARQRSQDRPQAVGHAVHLLTVFVGAKMRLVGRSQQPSCLLAVVRVPPLVRIPNQHQMVGLPRARDLLALDFEVRLPPTVVQRRMPLGGARPAHRTRRHIGDAAQCSGVLSHSG